MSAGNDWIGRKLRLVFGYDYDDQLTVPAPLMATVVAQSGQDNESEFTLLVKVDPPVPANGRLWSDWVLQSRHVGWEFARVLNGDTIAVAGTAIPSPPPTADPLDVSWWRGQTPGKIGSVLLAAISDRRG